MGQMRRPVMEAMSEADPLQQPDRLPPSARLPRKLMPSSTFSSAVNAGNK